VFIIKVTKNDPEDRLLAAAKVVFYLLIG